MRWYSPLTAFLILTVRCGEAQTDEIKANMPNFRVSSSRVLRTHCLLQLSVHERDVNITYTHWHAHYAIETTYHLNGNQPLRMVATTNGRGLLLTSIDHQCTIQKQKKDIRDFITTFEQAVGGCDFVNLHN